MPWNDLPSGSGAGCFFACALYVGTNTKYNTPHMNWVAAYTTGRPVIARLKYRIPKELS